MKRGGATYIMTNKNKTTLYIGATSDLKARVLQHKGHYYKNSFSDRYNLEQIIWFQTFNTIEEALAFEKKIKGWKRSRKEELINEMNPEWNDLCEIIYSW